MRQSVSLYISSPPPPRLQSSPELILRQSVARHQADSVLPAASRFPLDLAAVRHHLQTDSGRSKALLLQALRRVCLLLPRVCERYKRS